MKTSKYIQIALLLFIIGVTFTLFINSKMYEKNTHMEMFHVDTKTLESFSVVVAEKDANFQIVLDTINSVFAQYGEPGTEYEKYKFKEIRISQDTLFVSKPASAFLLFIKAKSIKKIIGKTDSRIHLSFNLIDTLSVDLDNSKLIGTLTSRNINSVVINARNQSEIEFVQYLGKSIDSISKLQTFKRMGGVLKQAKITLKDNSRLTMPNVKKLDMDADNSSTYKIENMFIYSDN